MQGLKIPVPARFSGWVLPIFCLLLIGAAIAVTQFDLSVSKLLVWTLVLACPLSHFLFGHRGHGHAAEAAQHGSKQTLTHHVDADLHVQYQKSPHGEPGARDALQNRRTVEADVVGF